jgi:hypothetical protein
MRPMFRAPTPFPNATTIPCRRARQRISDVKHAGSITEQQQASMTTKRPRMTPKRRTKTPQKPARKRSATPRTPRAPRDPNQPIPDIARRYAANIVKRLWPSLFEKAFGHAAAT